jgi:DivIVA domain-containing protein
MELTPQALHDVEFREARRGGYNTRDVDDFLERVAVGIGQLQDRLREAYHRAEAAEGRLADMQRQLDDLQRRGVPAPHDAPPSPVSAGGGDADETLRRTLVLAQRTADATIKEAKDEAARLLNDAREEAAHTRAAAETEAMRDAQAEVDHLLEAREALLHDIDMLERHVDEQRGLVKGSVDELQRLLDDPTALNVTPAPSITDVSRRPGPPPADGPRPELPPRDSAPREREPLPMPVPAADPSGNGGYVPKGGQVTIPAPPLDPPAPSGPPPGPSGSGAGAPGAPGAPANGQIDNNERVVSSNPNPLNDGAMVAALQELHGSLPSRDPLPARGEPLPSLPSRGDVGRDPSPSVPPPPDPSPVHEPFESLPGLPSRGDAGPVPSPVHEPFESLPGLPSRGDAGPVPSPVHEPFESLPSLPSRDGGAGREPLPSRGDAGAGREPLLARNSGQPPEPLNFPPPTPGTTGFLPDLNAAFNPPPPPPEDLAAPAGPGLGPVDDLPLPIDAPPPPPPPPGFEHLHEVGGIPIEPGSRPSEWGRGVFDAEDELDGQPNGARFGRRR